MWMPASDQHADTVRIARAARDGAERRAEIEAKRAADEQRFREGQQHEKDFTFATWSDVVGRSDKI